MLPGSDCQSFCAHVNGHDQVNKHFPGPFRTLFGNGIDRVHCLWKWDKKMAGEKYPLAGHSIRSSINMLVNIDSGQRVKSDHHFTKNLML